jgi:hypothetical protein
MSRLPHFVYTIGLQMAVRLSILRASRPLLPGRFVVLISVRGWVKEEEEAPALPPAVVVVVVTT